MAKRQHLTLSQVHTFTSYPTLLQQSIRACILSKSSKGMSQHCVSKCVKFDCCRWRTSDVVSLRMEQPPDRNSWSWNLLLRCEVTSSLDCAATKLEGLIFVTGFHCTDGPPLQRSSSSKPTLMIDHPDDRPSQRETTERPPWSKTTDHPNNRPSETTLLSGHLMKLSWWQTTLMRDHPDEWTPWWVTTWYHPDERPPGWYHPNERPPSWQTTLMRDHPDGWPPWWETTLMIPS